jgi:hypothetical protein
MTSIFANEINETRALLANAWDTLPYALRGPTQFLGRQYAGCGATIGVMPRCDFRCTACYLGNGANRARPLPMEEIKGQIRTLRRWLGPAGNLQLTDGEVTLRSESELIQLIAYARQVGLVPMVMTHGETFRRKPGFLERLMTQGGLTEVCFHVDTTMRGRCNQQTGTASEEDLNSLRAEFAEMIRRARRHTGRRLEAASTVTVTPDNLEGVPDVVRWFLSNADAFKMVSFQPVAAVGRTGSKFQRISPDRLWARIAEGADNPSILEGEGWLGHPGCGRFVQGLTVHRNNRVKFVPLYRRDHSSDVQFLNKLLDRIGGTSFRLDTGGQAIRRIAYILKHNAVFLLRYGFPYAWRLLRQTGTLNARYFCIVSHHFMNATEMTSPLGAKRQSVCVFRVPISGRLEPMCRVNAGGLRAKLYQSAGKTPVRRKAA